MKDFSLNARVFNRHNLYKRVSDLLAATTGRNLDTSVPTVIQKPLANTVAKNTHSKSAQKQKSTANVQIARKTMTQIQLSFPNTENNNKFCMKTVGSHDLGNKTKA